MKIEKHSHLVGMEWYKTFTQCETFPYRRGKIRQIKVSFLAPKGVLKLFSFQVFWFWPYLIKVFPETRRALNLISTFLFDIYKRPFLNIKTCLEYNENKKYNTVETIRKSIITIESRGKIDTSNTQIHDCSLSLPGTGHSM